VNENENNNNDDDDDDDDEDDGVKAAYEQWQKPLKLASYF